MGRRKKVLLFIFLLFALILFLYQLGNFYFAWKIREALQRKGIGVKSVTLSLLGGSLKIKKLEWIESKFHLSMRKVKVRFSLRDWLGEGEKKIREVRLEDGEVILPVSKGIEDPPFPPIEKVILKDILLKIPLSQEPLRVKMEGEILNVKEGEKASLNLKGNIFPHSPFTLRGKFVPFPWRRDAYLEGEVKEIGKTLVNIFLPNSPIRGEFPGEVNFWLNLRGKRINIEAVFSFKHKEEESSTFLPMLNRRLRIQAEIYLPEREFEYRFDWE